MHHKLAVKNGQKHFRGGRTHLHGLKIKSADRSLRSDSTPDHAGEEAPAAGHKPRRTSSYLPVVPLDVEAAAPLFSVDFFTAFLWLFLVAFAAGFEAVEELCAGALAWLAAVCAANVNGTAAAVKASARIVFFIVVSLPAGRFVYRPLTIPSCGR